MSLQSYSANKVSYALQHRIGYYGKVWWTQEVTKDPIKAYAFCFSRFINYDPDFYMYLPDLFPLRTLSLAKINDKIYANAFRLHWNKKEFTRRILVIDESNPPKLKFRKTKKICTIAV